MWRRFDPTWRKLVVNGAATQAQVAQAFGIPIITVKRAVKKLRAQGTAGFYARRRGRGATVLTAAKLAQAQERLDQGQAVSVVAQELGVKKDCLRKAIAGGRLHRAQGGPRPGAGTSNKSERAVADQAAPHGMGATRT